MKCTALSREFAYANKMSDLAKLTDAKQKLTEHWNETYSDIFGKLHNDERMHREFKQKQIHRVERISNVGGSKM